VGLRKSGHEQICRKHRYLPAARLTGTGARLLARPAILGTGVRDRGNDGGTRLAVRAFSAGPPCELHSARQSRVDPRCRTAQRGCEGTVELRGSTVEHWVHYRPGRADRME
jgi:hypothetical protein